MSDLDSPNIPKPLPASKKPRSASPPNAWDCHAHIFGDVARFPLVEGRAYTPQRCEIADYTALMANIGLAHVVIVQPSIYGSDNSCTLASLRASQGAWRGIAVVDPNVSEQELQSLHEAGFRGIRLNIATSGNRDILKSMSLLADRIKSLGWHIQMFVKGDDLPGLLPVVTKLPVDVVLDHMGGLRADPPRYATLLPEMIARLRDGRLWIKLSAPYRVTRAGPPYDDVAPIASALAAANPDRMLWGSDWPHTWHNDPTPFSMPDDANLFDLLTAWVPDENARRKILVDNPQRLYA